MAFSDRPHGHRVDVSVVVPCRNGQAYLHDMIASVAAQTAAPRRAVLVDDGSTDDSAAIARRGGWDVIATSGDARQGKGIGVARNLAIASASTQYVAFLDADDWWEPDHLEAATTLLDEHPDALVAFARLRLSNGGPVAPLPATMPTGCPFDAYPVLLASNVVPVSAAVVRTDALRAVDGFDTRPERHGVEDYDLWLRLARLGPFVFRDAVGLNYRVHPGQMSRNTERMAVSALLVQQAQWVALVGDRERSDVSSSLVSAAAAGWETSLDVLWYYGHVAAYARWANEFRTVFGRDPRDAWKRTGTLGRVHTGLRRAFDRIPA